MTLNINQIKNSVLKAIAEQADCIDENIGILNLEEFSVFLKKANDACKIGIVSENDINQAIGLYKSTPSTLESSTKPSTYESSATQKLEKPSLVKIKRNIKVWFGLTTAEKEFYEFEHNNKKTALTISNSCNSYKYKEIFDAFIKYSTPEDADISPKEAENIEDLLYSIPGDSENAWGSDTFSMNRDRFLKELKEAQSKDSDKGNTISVKEQQRLLNIWTSLAQNNVYIYQEP